MVLPMNIYAVQSLVCFGFAVGFSLVHRFVFKPPRRRDVLLRRILSVVQIFVAINGFLLCSCGNFISPQDALTHLAEYQGTATDKFASDDSEVQVDESTFRNIELDDSSSEQAFYQILITMNKFLFLVMFSVIVLAFSFSTLDRLPSNVQS